MKFINSLLSSGTGVSTLRFMCVVCCLTATIIAFIGIYKQQPDYSGLTMLCSAFLGAAFTGKIMQKREENKQPKQ